MLPRMTLMSTDKLMTRARDNLRLGVPAKSATIACDGYQRGSTHP